MKCLISILFHSFLAIIILSSYTQAETIVLDVFDQGTYNSGFGYDSHFPNETEAGTGQTTYLRPVDNPGVVYRHFHNAFFVFDLTSINNIIYSANLEIELQNYYSRDSSESSAVYDVVTPIDELIAGGRQLWDPIGIDLETGIVYGSATIQQTDVGSIISIQLSDATISDLNSSFGGFFALGVHSTTSDNPEPGLYNIDYISFGEQGDGVQQLVLETTPIPEPVDIDIKPHSCPNECSIQGGGSLEVAILGTADFDAMDIDIASVRLEGIAPVRSSLKDKSTPVGDPVNECDCNTEGGDGYIDLCLKFDKKEVLRVLGEVNVDDSFVLKLTGSLNDGIPIEGQDCIVMVQKGKKD